MNHILVLPTEFETKLNESYLNDAIHSKWLEIGVDTANDMKSRITSMLNEKYPKLCIVDWRIEDKDTIKEKVGNNGSNSVYAGYFENEKEIIDGLFFYIPPSLNTGNDFLTRQVIPSLIGIYEGTTQETEDMHFNNKPVYILNLNETNRSNQRAVKVSFLCAEMLGFKYLDIFSRDYHDIIENEFPDGAIKKLSDFNQLFIHNGSNDWFYVDEENLVLKLLSSKVTNSTNPSAEMYRYCLKILPAIYMAIDENYRIDIEEFAEVHMSMFDVIRTYLSKI